MGANESTGKVKKKLLRRLKDNCEILINRLINIMKREEMIFDDAMKSKQQELENGQNKTGLEIDNSMFGQEVLEELGITKEKSGEYVMAGKQENQEQKQDDELLL